MATPEQNTLLGLQLFAPVAQQYNQQNDARTNLMLRIAREGQRLTALQTREDTRVAESERRQGAAITAAEKRQEAALDAAEKKQITAEMNRLYPQYAAAAAQAGVEIKQRAEFPETNEGLGQLAADLSTAKIGFDEKRLKGAATALVGGLDEAIASVGTIKSRIAELSKPQPQEQKVARSQAVKALQTALENGAIASAAKLRPKAIKDGIAALTRGEENIARELLGDEAMAKFEDATEQVLLGLDSRKSAMQERNFLNQQLLQLQTQAARQSSDVMKAAATNTFLADELEKRRTPLQQLMTPVETPQRRRSFDELTPATGGAGTQPPPQKPTTSLQTIGPGIAIDHNVKVAPYTGGGLGFGFGGIPIASNPSVMSSPVNPLLEIQSSPAPAITKRRLPVEVEKAASFIANNQRSRGLEPYYAVVKNWLDNDGIGQPWSEENVRLRRLLTPLPPFGD